MAEPADRPAGVEIASLADLLAIAQALAATGDPPCPKGDRHSGHAAAITAAITAAIRAGDDPLGDALTRLLPAVERRPRGQVLTPPWVIAAMIGWARTLDPPPLRVVDAGAGSGRFAIAAAQAWADAEIIAVESDPLMAAVLRGHVAALGLAGRIVLRVGDYLTEALPPIAGRTLFLGNPPYVRHHGLAAAAKDRYAALGARFGVRASRLAGLHLHFFLRTLELARPGDALCFITAAEWLDVNYGAALRTLLPDRFGLRSIDRIAATASVFPGTLASAAITACVIGQPAAQIALKTVADAGALAPLGRGRPVAAAMLRKATRWSPLFDQAGHRPTHHNAARHDDRKVGDLFRVSRGAATGANRVWIAGPAGPASGLPRHFLVPAVTRGRELFAAPTASVDIAALRRVVALPADLEVLDTAEHAAVEAFLAWARQQGAHLGYLAQRRQAWHALTLPPPAPILCSYMARRAPVFVRNRGAARHLNICHGLYPRLPMAESVLDHVAAWLNQFAGIEGGRIYAGGLVKYEPREVENLPLPALCNLLGKEFPAI